MIKRIKQIPISYFITMFVMMVLFFLVITTNMGKDWTFDHWLPALGLTLALSINPLGFLIMLVISNGLLLAVTWLPCILLGIDFPNILSLSELFDKNN